MKKEKAGIVGTSGVTLAPVVRQPVQARSRDRVERILEATEALIEEHPMQEITIAMIAARSGVGRATIYQFFPTVQAILHTLGLRFLDELYADISSSAAVRDAVTWQEAADLFTEITVNFYRRRPSACVLFLGDGSLHGLRVIAHDFDKRFVKFIKESLGKKLRIDPTQMTGLIEVVVTVSISVLSLSVFHHGKITDYYREQAKTVVRGYLNSIDNAEGRG